MNKSSIKQIKREQDADSKLLESLLEKEARAEMSKYGYVAPKGADYYRVIGGKYTGAVGVKVGSFIHSCHVDSTDYVVLLFVRSGQIFVEHFVEYEIGESGGWAKKI